MIGGVLQVALTRAGRAFFAATALALAGSALASEPNAQRVNHFVGAAGESVSIQVPPFHGIEPRLSLSYSSEARNGFAGMGWNLTGFSVIERVNGAWGVPLFTSDDVFTLDGQTLLECVPAAASYPSCAAGGTHYTQQESYLRIKKISDLLWEVYGKDGTKTEFAPIHTVPLYEGGPTYSMILGQSKVVDTHGNTVNYNWAVNAGGVSGATYPSSVSYNGYTVEFFRETRPEGALTRGLWRYVGRLGERLKSIVVRQAGGTKIRAYKLTYTTSAATGKSLLSSVQTYGSDVAVDGSGTITSGTSLPEQAFGYTADSASASFTGDVQMSNSGPPPMVATENVVWWGTFGAHAAGDGSTLEADVFQPDQVQQWRHGNVSRQISSGSGYVEFTYTAGTGNRVLYFGQHTLYLYSVYSGQGILFSYGSGWLGPYAASPGQILRIEVSPTGVQFKINGVTQVSQSLTTTYPVAAAGYVYENSDQLASLRISGSLTNAAGADCGGSQRYFGDFNGDGRKDSVCRTSAGAVAVTLATETGFLNPNLWASWGSSIAGVGDFNNDGKDDIVFFDSFWGRTYVGLSDGNDFGAITDWGFMGGYGDGCRMNGAKLGKVGDFNGDGRADVPCYIPGEDPQYQYVGISTGTSFVSVLFGNLGCQQPNGNIATNGQADFNGDGRDDWFCINTYNGEILTFFSLGMSLSYLDTALPGFCSANEYSFGDWNGDGATDIACANNLRGGLQTGRRFDVLENPSPTAWCVSGQRLAADLDGDGAAEWICNNPGTPANDIEVRRWNGLAFGAAQTWRAAFCGGTVSVADFNGDAKQDLLCDSTGAAIYAGTKNAKADLLAASANGIGGQALLTWNTSTLVAQNAAGGTPTAGLPAKYLVTISTATDGRSTPQSTTFVYREGAQDDAERKFFGFGTVIEYKPRLPGESESPFVFRTFFTDKSRAGRLSTMSQWSGATSLKMLSQISYEYATTETTGAGARRTALLSAVWDYKFTGLTGNCASWPCASAKRTKKTFSYDAYGNVVNTVDYGEVGAADANGLETPLSGDETLTTNFYTSQYDRIHRWAGGRDEPLDRDQPSRRQPRQLHGEWVRWRRRLDHGAGEG